MNSTQAIRKRLLEAGVSFAPNANIAEHLRPGDIEVIQAEVERHMQAVLDALVIDTNRDHNTQGTAKRIAKMYVREVFAAALRLRPRSPSFRTTAVWTRSTRLALSQCVRRAPTTLYPSPAACGSAFCLVTS